MNEDSIAPLDAQEDESDIFPSDHAASFNAAVASSDWTTETIVSQLRKGNIDLDPSFQRREAWQRTRKSQFIESLILGIPTPQIILAERKGKRGSYIVIDGKQRLLTLRQFIADDDDKVYKKFRLGGLLALPELNGKSFEKLSSIDSNPVAALENANIRTVIIKNWSSEEFLYEVFLRINSGSVQLSPQELRQALHPGPFTTYLNDFTLDSDTVRRALGLKAPDFRMRDNELVLRYVAMRDGLAIYNGNLKVFFDKLTAKFNGDWEIYQPVTDNYFRDLENAIAVTFDIFGSDAFKKWNGNNYESRLNRAVFDVMSYFFSFSEISLLAREKSHEVVDAFKILCERNSDFSAAITSTTKSIDAVKTRYSCWKYALEITLNISIPFPRF